MIFSPGAILTGLNRCGFQFENLRATCAGSFTGPRAGFQLIIAN
jgi:hypothetical protein